MLDNELIILPTIVAIGFVGWMMLMFVQILWLDEFPPAQKRTPQEDTATDKPKKEFLKAA